MPEQSLQGTQSALAFYLRGSAIAGVLLCSFGYLVQKKYADTLHFDVAGSSRPALSLEGHPPILSQSLSRLSTLVSRSHLPPTRACTARPSCLRQRDNIQQMHSKMLSHISMFLCKRLKARCCLQLMGRLPLTEAQAKRQARTLLLLQMALHQSGPLVAKC